MDSRTKKTNNKRFVRYSEGAEMLFNECVKVYAVSEGCKGML